MVIYVESIYSKNMILLNNGDDTFVAGTHIYITPPKGQLACEKRESLKK